MTTSTLTLAQQLLQKLKDYVVQVWGLPADTEFLEAEADDELVYAALRVDQETDTFSLFWDEDENEFMFGITYNQICESVDYYTEATNIDEITLDVLDEIITKAVGDLYMD